MFPETTEDGRAGGRGADGEDYGGMSRFVRVVDNLKIVDVIVGGIRPAVCGGAAVYGGTITAAIYPQVVSRAACSSRRSSLATVQHPPVSMGLSTPGWAWIRNGLLGS